MNGQDDDQSRVCYGCIADAVLAADVKQSGRRSRCSYCARTREAIPLEELADQIDPVVQEAFVLSRVDDRHYVHSSTWGGMWEQDGDPVEHIIAEIAGLEPKIAEDLRELLSGRYAYPAIKDGDDDPYDLPMRTMWRRNLTTGNSGRLGRTFCRDIQISGTLLQCGRRGSPQLDLR